MSTALATATRLAPLLEAEDLRIDVDGVPACDGLTFRTKGEHVLVLGAPRALSQAALGLAEVVRGSLAVRGTEVAEAARVVLVAGAPSDAPMPPRFTVVEYVEWSARLAGVPRSSARASTDAALERLRLGPMARTELARLVPHALRATRVAAALASAAEVIVLEDPVSGLADEIAADYAKVLADALSDHAWILFAPRLPLGSALARAADEAIVATSIRVDAQGTPAELASADRRFVVRIEGTFELVAAELERRGAKAEVHGAHLRLDLGARMTTSELMELCDDAGLAVIELAPAFRAFS